MKKFFKYTLIVLSFAIFFSCELYPDWEKNIEYSDAYPFSGEWYVHDYYTDIDSVSESYILYVYNKSYNPTRDSIWIDNKIGHPVTGSVVYPFMFKIKVKANKLDYSFNCTKQGNITGVNVNPLADANTVTISDSKVWDYSSDIQDATPDSISFRFIYYNSAGVEVSNIQVAGHRKTGWENPEYDDNM